MNCFCRIRDFLKEQYPSFEFDKEVLEDLFIQYLSKYGRCVIAFSDNEIQIDDSKRAL